MVGTNTVWGLRKAGVMMAAALALLAGCNNSPWPEGAEEDNTVFSGLIETTPRHLDPTASYWSNDTTVTYQVYEPLYGYHQLKRPFELVPKAAERVVPPRYLDKDGHVLPADTPAEQIAESVYDIPIRKGIRFAPHPAFAKNAAGDYVYHHLKPGELGERRKPGDFEQTGSRELVAEDFVYGLKRHATTRITTPIYGIFSEYVLGLKDYGALVKAEDAKLRAGLDAADPDKPFLDFRRWPLVGATAPEPHLLRIRLHGKYPQWKYWMAMTFLAPIAWEADAFYAQPGMVSAGLTLDTFPVGTGPYMLTEFAKDRGFTMVRNPNYRGVPYPCEGEPGDKAAGLLADCGKKTPFIDTFVASVEREATPLKNKFRDGYYDFEDYSFTNLGTSYNVEARDSEAVRAVYEERGMIFPETVDVNSYFIAFNMLDPNIGWGDTPEMRARNRKLRQAISIAIDWEEYSKIFPKKAGQTAQTLLPPGIFGSREGTEAGVNPITHTWQDGKAVRRPLEDAQKLMVEAGYPGGRDAQTGRPLIINYDYYAVPSPERKPEIDWVVRQFGKLGIQVEVRATDNSQFQDKVRKGKHQMFWIGWNADYPDAENFYFLFYGPNSKSVSDGENTSNYQNPEFDKLFTQLKSLDDGPEKQAVIDQLQALLREDAPLSFGFYPFAANAKQDWVKNGKNTVMLRDQLQYYRLDAAQRTRNLADWNHPIYWPLAAIALGLLGLWWLARRTLAVRERMNARGELLN